VTSSWFFIPQSINILQPPGTLWASNRPVQGLL